MITKSAETARTSTGEKTFALPALPAVMSQAGSENFPVALRVIPERLRTHLLAIYGFARLTDDIGDEYQGDRSEALNWLDAQIDSLFEGVPEHPVFQQLAPTVERFGITREPLDRLLAANRMDQVKTRYETWDELMEYCSLSADPVGHLVLAVFEADTPSRREASDSVCSALQVIEHICDIVEDAKAGRVYVPQDVMSAFGCPESDLNLPTATPALREVLSCLANRSRGMLAPGRELTSSLRGYARLAVSGFVGGGLATLAAVESAGYDVIARRVRRGRLRAAFLTMGLSVGIRIAGAGKSGSRRSGMSSRPGAV